MSPLQRLINFGVCIGMPDSGAVSMLNRWIVKPVDWLVGQEDLRSAAQFVSRHVIARVVAAAASAFALLDAAIHAAVILAKCLYVLPKGSSKRIRGHWENLKQSLYLAAVGTALGFYNPAKLGARAYPVSEKDKTPIFGYHEVRPLIQDAWTVSPQLLSKHLDHLRRHDYELCTLKEFFGGYQPRPGKKLAVMTFDDSHESQFRLMGTDANGSLDIDPNCAIGVFDAYRNKHPGFRCVATFFVNTSEDAGTSGSRKHMLFAEALEQKQYIARKLRYLLDQGHEIAAHGHFHCRFDKLSEKDLAQDTALFDRAIQNIKQDAPSLGIDLSDLSIHSFAWPHGLVPSKSKRRPIDERFQYVADFGFNGGKMQRVHGDVKRIKRLYIGPSTGFAQYAP